MKKLSFIFCIIVLFYSCSPVDNGIEESTPETPAQGGNPPGNPVQTFNLNTETTNVVVQKIIKVTSNNQQFTSESYNGKFGDLEIELIRDPEGNLAFAIPTINPGTYTLKISIDGKEGITDIKVDPNNIPDVNATLKSELESPLAALSKDLERFKNEGNLSSNSLKELNSALKMYSEFNSKLSTLSDDEKKSVAGFFKANPILSSNLNEEYISSFRESTLEFECFNKNSLSFTTSSKIIQDWEELAVVLKATNAEGMVASGVGAYVAAYLSSAVITASQEKLTTTCKRPVATQLLDEDGNTNTLKLVNNVASNFKVKNTVRALITSDVSDPNENVSKIVQEINNLNTSWNGLMGYLNPVLSVNSNWFNQWFSNQNNFEPISMESLNVPANAQESQIEGKSQPVSITNLPSGINFTLEKNESNILKITLQAEPSLLPTDVTGKIHNNNGGFTTESDFSASLTGIIYKLEIGHLTLDQKVITDKIISNNDQVTLPNNVSQYVRLTVDGEPLTIGGDYGGWYLWYFGDGVEKPEIKNDIFIEDYEIDLPDYVHGNVEAKLKIDLTLSNEAFRNILNQSFKFTLYMQGIRQYDPVVITFAGKGNYSVSYSNVQESGVYSFFLGGLSRANMQCVNGIIDNEIIASIRLSISRLWPEFIYVQKDGTLRANVFPYGCVERSTGWLIEKVN